MCVFVQRAGPLLVSVALLCACSPLPVTRTSQPTPEVAIMTAVAAAQLGVIVDETNQILAVEVGSAAENAGIQVGDRLDALDGVSFREKESVKALIHAATAGQSFTLKLVRNNTELILNISPAPPAFRLNAPTPTPVVAPQDYF